MKERKPIQPRINFFSFICQEEKLGEAEEVLSGIGGISIDPKTFGREGVLFIDDGFVKREVNGNIVSGIVFGSSLNRITIELTERNIAGHSFEFPIFHEIGEIIRPKNT